MKEGGNNPDLGTRLKKAKIGKWHAEEQAAKAEKRANTDPLTEILNRRGFKAQVSGVYDILNPERRIEDPSKHALVIVMADIDFFKKINDTYGHKAGDDVLVAVSQYFKNTMRTDDVVARVGGEEFVLALKDISYKDAAELVEKLREGIAGLVIDVEIQRDGERVVARIPVTMSFGIATNEEIPTLDDAMKFADKALYGAKTNGRNKVALSADISAGSVA